MSTTRAVKRTPRHKVIWWRIQRWIADHRRPPAGSLTRAFTDASKIDFTSRVRAALAGVR